MNYCDLHGLTTVCSCKFSSLLFSKVAEVPNLVQFFTGGLHKLLQILLFELIQSLDFSLKLW